MKYLLTALTCLLMACGGSEGTGSNSTNTPEQPPVVSEATWINVQGDEYCKAIDGECIESVQVPFYEPLSEENANYAIYTDASKVLIATDGIDSVKHTSTSTSRLREVFINGELTESYSLYMVNDTTLAFKGSDQYEDSGTCHDDMGVWACYSGVVTTYRGLIATEVVNDIRYGNNLTTDYVFDFFQAI